MLANSFFSFSKFPLSISLFFKEKAQFVALYTLFSERADILPQVFKNNLKFNLQLTGRHTSAEKGTGAFLRFSKIFFGQEYAWIHRRKYTCTFILMNTERTYNIRTDSPAVFFRSTKKWEERRRNEKGKDEF